MLTKDQKMTAFKAVADFFTLRAAARTALGNAPHYEEILTAAHAGEWKTVACHLDDDEVISEDHIRAAMMEDYRS